MTATTHIQAADVGESPATLTSVADIPATVTNAADVASTTTPALCVGAAVVLLAAAGLFAFIARRVTTKESQPFDQSVRQTAQSHRTGLVDAATKPVTLLSIPLLVVSATAALVWWLKQNDRNAAAVAVGITPFVAATVGQSFTTLFAQPSPPGAADTPNVSAQEATFPSGHTTGVTAEALTVAYILTREELATPAVLASLLSWPFIVGVTRVYRDRHWASDILAGWVAGTGVAALSALFYEWSRRMTPANGSGARARLSARSRPMSNRRTSATRSPTPADCRS